MKLEGEKRDRVRLGVIAAVIVVGASSLFQQFGPEIDLEQLLEDVSSWLGAWTYLLVGAARLPRDRRLRRPRRSRARRA